MNDNLCRQQDRSDSLASIIPQAPVVMVAGPFGSGVEELGALLAERLHLPLYDPNKLDALARDREKHEDAWEQLKQGLDSFFDYWLGHLHGKPGLGRRAHLLYLEQILEKVAIEGGVIVGVCIHHMMPGQKLFRIKVDASVQFCARRLARIRHCSSLETVAVFYHMESEHSRFLESLFETAGDPIVYDLELDAEQLAPPVMLERCLHTMASRHFLEQAA